MACEPDSAIESPDTTKAVAVRLLCTSEEVTTTSSIDSSCANARGAMATATASVEKRIMGLLLNFKFGRVVLT